MLVFKWKNNRIYELFEKKIGNFENVEEMIFLMKNLTWMFLKGKKYNKESFTKFMGFIQKKIKENNCNLFNQNKKTEKVFLQNRKEEIQYMFYQIMLKNFKTSISK